MTIQLINQTPYTAVAWDTLNHKGDLYGTALLKGCFSLKYNEVENGLLDMALITTELVTEDRYYGEPGQSSLRYESDFVPYKSGTDIIANAIARTPKKELLTNWLCGVQIKDKKQTVQCEKILRVNGKRTWEKTLSGWKLSSPQPCNEVPIRYEYAYGGSCRKTNEDGEVIEYLGLDERNPIGRGYLHKDDKCKQLLVPQVENLDSPIKSPLDDYEPQGLGYIPRTWQPRRQLAGSYDEKWLAEKHPLLPDDFSTEHYRAAPPKQALKQYLKGGETVVLKHFSSESPYIRFKLPEYRFYSSLINHSKKLITLQPLELDTVLFDIESDVIDHWMVHLSWRGQHILPPDAKQLELFGTNESIKSN